MHGQDQHLGRQPTLANGARRIEPAHARHLDVHDDDVRLHIARGFDGGGAVGGFADDLDIRLGVEQRLQTGAQDGVVVGKYDANLGRDRRSCA